MQVQVLSRDLGCALDGVGFGEGLSVRVQKTDHRVGGGAPRGDLRACSGYWQKGGEMGREGAGCPGGGLDRPG